MPHHSIANEQAQQSLKKLIEILDNFPKSAEDVKRENAVNKMKKALASFPQSKYSQETATIFDVAFEAFSDSSNPDDAELAELLSQWNDYIITITHYSNTVFITAIKSQQADYMTAIAKIENQLKKERDLRRIVFVGMD